jgi:hypothetical protein
VNEQKSSATTVPQLDIHYLWVSVKRQLRNGTSLKPLKSGQNHQSGYNLTGQSIIEDREITKVRKMIILR